MWCFIYLFKFRVDDTQFEHIFCGIDRIHAYKRVDIVKNIQIKPDLWNNSSRVGTYFILKGCHSSQCDKLRIATIHGCFEVAGTLIGTRDAEHVALPYFGCR